MSTKELVAGLKITAPWEFDHVCEGCVLGKSHCLPFPKQSTTVYEMCEVIVVDAAGPMSHPTWSGMWYALLVVEVRSRKGWPHLSADKEKMRGQLMETVTMLERQSGKKVRMIRSDNGSEFVNSMVERFCKERGTIQQTTVPYTPEQNRIAERAIAIYFEMVRCMLHSARMDLQYWGEAFLYAVHIRNVSYTSALNGMVPEHAWSSRKPDISHLRIFGSTAYVNIPKKLRGGKLEATSVQCRLLGWWEGETKGYRLEDVKTRKIITSRDVRFIEDERPTDLAVIDGERTPPSQQDLDDLVPGVKRVEQPKTDTVSDKDADPPALPLTSASSSRSESESSDFDSEPRFEPDQPPVIPATPQKVADVAPPPPPAPKCARVAAKWQNLPARNHPARERRPVVPFGQQPTEAAQERAFVTFSNEPSTYREAAQSPNTKQWEQLIASEYGQMLATDYNSVGPSST